MERVLIVYATREGHSARIAKFVEEVIRSNKGRCETYDAAKLGGTLDLSGFSHAFVIASVHGGKHEPEMVQFVKSRRGELEHMYSVFLSVSLSQAGAEDEAAQPNKRARAAGDAQFMIDSFLRETGWHPMRAEPVAGTLAYSKYNPVMRLIMKWISWRAGGATDTSRDYCYTDWIALEALVNCVVAVQPVS